MSSQVIDRAMSSQVIDRAMFSQVIDGAIFSQVIDGAVVSVSDTIANKLHMQKVSDFVLSPGGQPSKVCVYVPGSKGAPSFVRLYQYPVLGGPTAALANKSFFKADRVSMVWNRKASVVLVTASTEVDKTGASYYGEQTLHYLAVNGETALVQL
ncbi:eukaryotic translation initiation factor 2A, partial [Etheostoma cragini]|uniref:eukaryotic translation initiation factor 2A n=1 Tax=Etheostoma cragini TaxID=417921 RepID=UPI00155F4150